MGNECEQCEAVTQGCKREQFRQQLKNRQKLDLSRAQGHERSKSKLDAINGLRNIPLIQASHYPDSKVKEQSIEQGKFSKPPPNITENIPENYQKHPQQNKLHQQNDRKASMIGTKSIQEINNDFKSIKLPIESGVGTRQKTKLQDLQNELNGSKRESQIYNNYQINKNVNNNSTIHIDDEMKVSLYQEQNKQNSQNINDTAKPLKPHTSQKQEKLILKKTKSIQRIQPNFLVADGQMLGSNPSKVLRQFNQDLKESNFNSHKYKQKMETNKDEGPMHDQSITQSIEMVKEHHYYVKPDIYFQGFVSTFDKKIRHQATITFESDKTEVSANFRNGNIDSQKNIIVAFNDNSYFEGLIQPNSFTCNGFGKFIFPDGSFYIGEWLDNLPHGKGKHQFPDGSSYEGQFVQGRKQGIGKFITSEEQLIYGGSFINNFIQGKGKMEIIQPNTGKKRIYTGCFKNGKLQGDDCEVQYVNESSKFIGSFRNGIKTGKGKYLYGDGRTWEGEWKDNRQNGFGKYKNIKGNIVEGYWMDGIKSQDKLFIH